MKLKEKLFICMVIIAASIWIWYIIQFIVFSINLAIAE